MQGMQVWSLVRDIRSHLPCSQRNQNMKQKKYCNKFNKDFKNDPHEKNLFKNCHLLNIYTANMNVPYRPPQSCHKPPWKDKRMRISVKKWLQGYKGQISQPSSLLGLWLFQWNHSNSGLIFAKAYLFSMAQNQTAMRWLHYTLVWTGMNIWEAPWCIYSLHMKWMWACEVWKCQCIELPDHPKDCYCGCAEKWRGVMWLISKGSVHGNQPQVSLEMLCFGREPMQVHWIGVQRRTMTQPLHGDRLLQTCISCYKRMRAPYIETIDQTWGF